MPVKNLIPSLQRKILYSIFVLMIKLTQHTLDKLQELFAQAGYTIRHEKGNFKSGSCIVEASKLIVLNKFSPVETKVSYLIEALRSMQLDESLLDSASKKLYEEARQTELKLLND
jgi:hypothetical protein